MPHPSVSWVPLRGHTPALPVPPLLVQKLGGTVRGNFCHHGRHILSCRGIGVLIKNDYGFKKTLVFRMRAVKAKQRDPVISNSTADNQAWMRRLSV